MSGWVKPGNTHDQASGSQSQTRQQFQDGACARHRAGILKEGYVVIGSPDEVADRLRRIVTEFNFGNLLMLLQFGNMDKQTTIFWLFFMFTALQPALRQRMLEAMRTRKIAQLESARNSRVILLVHRQETMRLLGFPVARYIDINDSEDVLRAIQMTDDDLPLDIILHKPEVSDKQRRPACASRRQGTAHRVQFLSSRGLSTGSCSSPVPQLPRGRSRCRPPGTAPCKSRSRLQCLSACPV
jgi:hypothetical protein